MKKIHNLFIPIVAFFFVVGIASAYNVEYGDTLSKIAKKANLSLSELFQLNPQIEDPDLIHPGDEINLEEITFGANLPIAGSTYNLAGSGVSSSATSITLKSLTLPQTGQKLVDSDFSDTFYVTLEPGNRKKQEIIACTTVTQNAGGDATLSGCSRGMSPITPYTASSTLQFTHGGGTQVIFSDPPQLFREYASKENTETVSGAWTFSTYPKFTDSTLCSDSEELCSKRYVDSVAIAGSPLATETVQGISELATQIEMASSTPWGALFPHVIQSQYASSTPSTEDVTGRALFVPISKNSGFLDINWFDLTEVWSFTDMRSASTTNSGNVLNTGNATSTGSAIFTGLLNSTGDNLFGNSTSTFPNTFAFNGEIGGEPTTTPTFAYHFLNDLLEHVNYCPYTGSAATSASGGGVATANASDLIISGNANPSSATITMCSVDTTKDFTFSTGGVIVNSAQTQIAFGVGVNENWNEPALLTADHAAFIVYAGLLEASVADGSTQSTSTPISGITITNFNNYKIERNGAEINFFVNGILKKTMTTNLPDSTNEDVGFDLEIDGTPGATGSFISNSTRLPFDFVGMK